VTAALPQTAGKLPETGEPVPTAEYDLFAQLVASGLSYAQSAEKPGFARESGRYLAHVPSVRMRIDSLIGDPDKARLIADYQLAVIRTREAVGNDEPGTENWRANMDLHLRVLDKLARVKGWIVDRKQVSQVTARLNVARGDLEAAIRADVERLAPGALRHIDAGGDIDVKAIAAGDVILSRAEQ